MCSVHHILMYTHAFIYSDMKRANLLVYIFVAGVILSCTPRASKTVVETFEISLSPVCEDDILLGMPNKLALSGDIMAISDTKMDSLVHFVNVRDGKYIGKGCAYGQGPNEMSMITSLSPMGEHGYTVYEPNRRTLYRMYPDGANGRIETLFHNGRDSVHFHREVHPLTDGNYVATGFYRSSQFCLLDSLGNVCRTFGEYSFRDEQEREVPEIVKSQVYQAAMTVAPSATHLLAYCLLGDILSFYKVEKGVPVLQETRCLSFPEYKYDGENYLGASQENKLAYLDATSTDDYIFLLYSGRSIREEGMKAFAGNTVCVYNWNAEKVAELKSDMDLKCLSLSPDGAVVYAIAIDGNPVLMKFSLPEKFQKR